MCYLCTRNRPESRTPSNRQEDVAFGESPEGEERPRVRRRTYESSVLQRLGADRSSRFRVLDDEGVDNGDVRKPEAERGRRSLRRGRFKTGACSDQVHERGQRSRFCGRALVRRARRLLGHGRADGLQGCDLRVRFGRVRTISERSAQSEENRSTHLFPDPDECRRFGRVQDVRQADASSAGASMARAGHVARNVQTRRSGGRSEDRKRLLRVRRIPAASGPEVADLQSRRKQAGQARAGRSDSTEVAERSGRAAERPPQALSSVVHRPALQGRDRIRKVRFPAPLDERERRARRPSQRSADGDLRHFSCVPSAETFRSSIRARPELLHDRFFLPNGGSEEPCVHGLSGREPRILLLDAPAPLQSDQRHVRQIVGFAGAANERVGVLVPDRRTRPSAERRGP
ncbi:serine/arginine repetitive matrix protein 2-like [Anneissia japonica]|uniref:serine/arginine repetitive matrix protein 2-like n=1 Tax=Anneissia japonica TaxID=1529436 RepID=UPI001425B558|nr:serine/arginine repetitive matrix protein 2-like [Anneissia japonica]